jgi:protein tyrosine/serine phosphatase
MRALISFLLTLSLTVCFAEEPKPAGPARELLTPRKDVPGVDNFAKISDGLYRGAQPTKEGFAELKKMGIKTVVNLRSFHSDRDEMKGTGLQYLHIYCKAWHPEDEDVLKFLKLINDPANQPVFVHCQHGADRTGMMVASYRIIEQGWNPDDAAKETHNFGFHKMFKDIQKYLKDFNRERMLKLLSQIAPPDVDVVK